VSDRGRIRCFGAIWPWGSHSGSAGPDELGIRSSHEPALADGPGRRIPPMSPRHECWDWSRCHQLSAIEKRAGLKPYAARELKDDYDGSTDCPASFV